MKHLKVAVVHDWIFTRRGGEKVLEHILDLFPEAHLYYLFGQPEKHLKLKNSHKMIPSFLSWVPGIQKIYQFLLPLLPIAAESFDLSRYDLVISSSSCVAKGIIPPPLGLHIAYIHSPMRYAWDQEHRYFPKPVSLLRPLEFLRRLFLHRLRIWDVTSSARIDLMIANSNFVARRCRLFYGRKSLVIFPPIDVLKFLEDSSNAKQLSFAQQNKKQKKVLLFGAWVPYKKMEQALSLLIRNRISVIAAGQGTELKRMQNRFSGQAEFVFRPSDEELVALYKSAHTLLFPALEDFGIVPLEATASGLWVVAPNQGGTAETVVDNVTGFLFRENDEVSLLQAVNRALEREVLPSDRENMRKHVEKFSGERFSRDFLNTIENLVQEKADAALQTL